MNVIQTISTIDRKLEFGEGDTYEKEITDLFSQAENKLDCIQDSFHSIVDDIKGLCFVRFCLSTYLLIYFIIYLL
jgi:hypothetical protein